MNLELAAANELHERSMQIIESALRETRPNSTTWRAQQIANEIKALRATLPSITISPCRDGMIEVTEDDGNGVLRNFKAFSMSEKRYEDSVLVFVMEILAGWKRKPVEESEVASLRSARHPA